MDYKDYKIETADFFIGVYWYDPDASMPCANYCKSIEEAKEEINEYIEHGEDSGHTTEFDDDL